MFISYHFWDNLSFINAFGAFPIPYGECRYKHDATALLLLLLTVTPRVHDKVVGIMVQTKLDITTVNKGR